MLVAVAVSVLSTLFVVTQAQQSEKEPKAALPAKEPAKAIPPVEQADANRETQQEVLRAKIEQFYATYDLKPRPLPTIPDNPPPHEGNLFALPEVVDTPDLLIIEVLEALPGRPIGGERLIRPNGTINLGFYGDVNVRGLTLEQVKVAVIKHLRRFLQDETLGLVMYDVNADGNLAPGDLKPFELMNPLDPGPRDNRLRDQQKEKAKKDNAEEVAPEAKPRTRSISFPANRQRMKAATRPVTARPRPIRRASNQDAEPAKPSQEIKVPVSGDGHVKITIEVQPYATHQDGAAEMEQPGDVLPMVFCPPQNSDRIFVDVTAYNSRNYRVEGDVLITGRLPFTGNETVLDVLDYAGGLLPTANPHDIRLVRPGQNGKPAQILAVDLEAIRDRGDKTKNYQMFPGDRLIVGRNESVTQMVRIERVADAVRQISAAMTQSANAARGIQAASPTNADALMKQAIDVWIKALNQSGEVRLDEAAIRKLLLQGLQSAPAGK
jgi:protein involved in polysaccharide export with SLBB domain